MNDAALDRLPVSSRLPANERLRVSVELTNICNFTCPFCPQATKGQLQVGVAPYSRRQGMVSAEVLERIIEECERVASVVELGFFGEQTLHADYVDFIKRLKQRSFDLELNTNISFVTHEVLDAWAEAKVDLVRLSLDAVTPDVFNRARPGQVRALDGRIVAEAERLEALHEKVDLWLERPDHCPTRLVFVKSSWNEGEQELFLERWLPRLGPDDYVLMKQVLSYGGKNADPKVQPVGHCNIWDTRFLVVDWQGNVSPCNLDANMDLKIGNLMDDSIESIYKGVLARRLRGLTGCGGAITPCSTCTDGNNWSANEIHRNPAFHPASRPSELQNLPTQRAV